MGKLDFKVIHLSILEKNPETQKILCLLHHILTSHVNNLKLNVWAGPVAQVVKCAPSAATARGSPVQIPGAHRRTAWQAMLWRRPI